MAGKLAGGVFMCLLIWPPQLAPAAEPLRDTPTVWYDHDQNHLEHEIRERDVPVAWDAYTDSFVRPLGRLTHPGRITRIVGSLFGGDRVLAAANINRLDEVVNSSWFTNRIGLFEMSPDEVARGPLDLTGPDMSATWTIVKAKSEGVTPGFNIRDPRGDVYVIKFDPPGHLNSTTAAGIISNRILYGAGYNVPGDYSVSFRRQQLILGEGVTIQLPYQQPRPMTEADVDSLLANVTRLPDGRWRALASKYLNGRPIGPFDYKGRRKDDPNDRIAHENRRELRGLYVFASWLIHYDTKQLNSLDMVVQEAGNRFVRHYLIDFASTVGTGARGPTRRFGYEFTFDVAAIGGRMLAFGLHDDPWRYLERPEGLQEVGYWETAHYHPAKFKPLQPNTAFANVTDRDGYWGAKIVSAFSDDQLRAIVQEARYIDPASADYVTRILATRRDMIARYWFDRVPPLDFFRWERDSGRKNGPGTGITADSGTVAPWTGTLVWDDLGLEHGIYPEAEPRYRYRLWAVTAHRKRAASAQWQALTDSHIPLAGQPALDADAGEHPFLELELQVDRGAGWSSSVKVCFAQASGRTVEVRR